jgi:vacuolar-type H+-ATPase subunit E/Vma4
MEHQEQILKAILHQIREEFLGIPEHRDYPEILKRLISNALGHLQEDGSAFICRVNERDQFLLTLPLLQALGEKAGKALFLDPDPVAIAGGVILYRKDRRVLFDNSLEALFERNREKMRCMAAECIFGTVL